MKRILNLVLSFIAAPYSLGEFLAPYLLLNTLKNAPHTPWLSEPNLTILIFEFNHKKSLISLLSPPPPKNLLNHPKSIYFKYISKSIQSIKQDL
jgi:hypothetical protein